MGLRLREVEEPIQGHTAPALFLVALGLDMGLVDPKYHFHFPLSPSLPPSSLPSFLLSLLPSPPSLLFSSLKILFLISLMQLQGAKIKGQGGQERQKGVERRERMGKDASARIRRYHEAERR